MVPYYLHVYLYNFSAVVLLKFEYKECKPCLRPNNTSFKSIGLHSTKSVHSVITDKDSGKCKYST